MTVKYRLLVTAGDNAERIRNEAAFAKHCGVAPPVRQQRRNKGQARLSRGGDRAVNSALCIVTIARMRHNGATRAYVERRTAEELSKREARGTVTARFARLQELGIVTSLTPRINPSAFGYGVLSFVYLYLVQGRLNEVVESVALVPEVVQAHTVTGDEDLLCQVFARNQGHFEWSWS